MSWTFRSRRTGTTLLWTALPTTDTEQTRSSGRVRHHVVVHHVLLGHVGRVRRRVHLLGRSAAHPQPTSYPTIVRYGDHFHRHGRLPSLRQLHPLAQLSPERVRQLSRLHDYALAIRAGSTSRTSTSRAVRGGRTLPVRRPDGRRRVLLRIPRSSGMGSHPGHIDDVLLDYSVTEDGFNICMSDTFVDTQYALPTTGADHHVCTNTHFEITEGGCHACGNCFHHAKCLSGDEYDHEPILCTITPLQHRARRREFRRRRGTWRYQSICGTT